MIDASKHARVPLRQSTVLVGRDRELDLLSQYLAETLEGRGRLVLVGGEAGIGKTTLVRWLADEAACQGALVLTGGCYDLTATPPYGPWIDAFNRYQATAETSLPSLLTTTGQTDTQTWFDTVRACLANLAVDQPLVVVLEDLHWSDPASLDLLRHVARRVDGLPILLVGTYRDDEVTSAHLLFQVLPLLVREADAERLDLRRLNRDAIQQAIAGRYQLAAADQRRLVDYLTRNSDGNPLFFSELLRTVETDQLLRPNGAKWTLTELRDPLLPPLLRQVIDRRLARLHPATRDALAIAAIIGDQPPLTLWSAVGSLTAEQLAHVVAEATEANVLVESPGNPTLRFSHALVREVIHATMALPLRQVWHRQVAEALLTGLNPDPDVVAYHFQQAGDERAIEWHVRAGLQTRRTAWISAGHHLETAATLMGGDQTHERERGWLRYYAAYLLLFTGNPRSIRLLDAAEETAIAIGDPILAAYACYTRGSQRCMLGDIHRGFAEIRQGVAAIDVLLETQCVSDNEAHALAAIQRLLPTGAAGHDLPETVQPQDAGNRSGINPLRGEVINWLGKTGRYHEAVVAGEAFINSLRIAFGDGYLKQEQCIIGLLGLGHAYAGLGRPRDARQTFARTRAGWYIIGDYAMVEDSIAAELVMTLIPYDAEQLAERDRLMKEDIEAWERCRGITITTAGDGAPGELQLDLLEGRWGKARTLATDHLPAPWITQAQEAIVTLAILARHGGEPGQAWERVAQLLPHGPATEPGNSYFAHAITGIFLAAELALDAGDLMTARWWIEAHGRWLDWSGAKLWQADHHLLWTRFHQCSGDLPLARRYADRALALASDPRQPLRLIAVYRMLGGLDRREGHHDRAAAHLDTSVSLAAACAAPFERALSLLALAEIHVDTRQFAAAQSLLDEAREICEPLEARPTLERIAALDAQIAHSVPVASGYPDGLTAREVEVLRLIAAGHSNRVIADVLFISPRTVERHIANIYLKIDAHNKAEASAYALLHELA